MPDINLLEHALTDEMLVDIYASTDRDEISILYEKPLRDEVDYVSVSTETGTLLFHYKNHTVQRLGSALKDDLLEKFKQTDNVALFQIDMRNKLPVAASKVAVKHDDPNAPHIKETA